MPKRLDREENSEFDAHGGSCEALELSGALGNLVRLLFSEAWRTKSQPSNRAVTFDLPRQRHSPRHA